MFGGFWTVIRFMCFTVVLAEDFTESVRTPTLEIIQKGNDLHFQTSPPNSSWNPHCWKYKFEYTKCNEGKIQVNATSESSWIATVQYDVACRYAVTVQAIFDLTYCGTKQRDSEISEPVYFGENSDPDLAFKVAMIVIPLIICSCLVIAMLLFRRHKEKFLPKVPSPSNFFKDMFDNNKEMTKGLYVTDLYVPHEEVVEQIHVEKF